MDAFVRAWIDLLMGVDLLLGGRRRGLLAQCGCERGGRATWRMAGLQDQRRLGHPPEPGVRAVEHFDPHRRRRDPEGDPKVGEWGPPRARSGPVFDGDGGFTATPSLLGWAELDFACIGPRGRDPLNIASLRPQRGRRLVLGARRLARGAGAGTGEYRRPLTKPRAGSGDWVGAPRKCTSRLRPARTTPHFGLNRSWPTISSPGSRPRRQPPPRARRSCRHDKARTAGSRSRRGASHAP